MAFLGGGFEGRVGGFEYRRQLNNVLVSWYFFMKF